MVVNRFKLNSAYYLGKGILAEDLVKTLTSNLSRWQAARTMWTLACDYPVIPGVIINKCV